MGLFSSATGVLVRFIEDLRIAMTFPAYERECRLSHLAEASRRFDTTPVRAEAATVASQITESVEQAFGERLRRHRLEIARLTQLVGDTRSALAIFERDYTSELDALYAQKEKLYEDKRRLGEELTELQTDHSAARDVLNAAYQDLESAKRSVSGWHGKSKRSTLLLGNAGRKLPKHSLFGQSFGDLDGYKRARSSAASDIGHAKQRVSDIRERMALNKAKRDSSKTDIDRLKEAIAATKAARQRMHDLRHQGVQPEFLKIAMAEQTAQLATEQEFLQAAESERKAYTDNLERDLGYRTIMDRIGAMDTERAQFMAAFEHSTSLEARKLAHREQWLARRAARSAE